MWYLYMDESGDLGFDFVTKKPSNFFGITLLLVKGKDGHRELRTAVRRTLRNKINPKSKRKRLIAEIKANSTVHSVKEYLLRQMKQDFILYSIVLDKRKALPKMFEDKSRVYNYISRCILDEIPFEEASTGIHLIVDKSKGKSEIMKFNEAMFTQLKGRVDPSVPLRIFHENSQMVEGLQCADLFSWGIFRKYEKNDVLCYDLFSKKIAFEKLITFVE
jgi:hypothetical protein